MLICCLIGLIINNKFRLVIRVTVLQYIANIGRLYGPVISHQCVVACSKFSESSVIQSHFRIVVYITAM